MQVLIIRHAIAEDRDTFVLSGQADELRPLSNKGKFKMRKNVQGLLTLIPYIHRVASSPLRRALQTADIVAHAYPDARRDDLPPLAPRGEPALILDYLSKHPSLSTIALIGHEPDLGELTTWLLSGHTDAWLPLRKGAACLLEFPGTVAQGQAQLRWLLTPAQLKKLGS